ncbi:MAG: hypothetical protein LBT96_03775 [Campylobacteraceae bacterium]|jgi:hypothetical protein|nr:hypothetical protein [Campylobacteraceae bacterium]
MEKRFIAGVFATITIGVIIFFFYNKVLNYEEQVGIEKEMDFLISVLNSKLNETSSVALSSSLVLSKNPYIIKCLPRGNDAACLEYIPDFEMIMEKHKVFKNMIIHLHASDHSKFICLNHHKTRAEITSAFTRKSLEKAEETKEPVQGIEIGRYGIFKSVIVPIFEKDSYIGAIETVVFLKEYTEFFKNMEIDLYILMKNSYLPTVSRVEYPEKLILKNYTIVNQETNTLTFLKDAEFSGTGYLKHGGKYIVYTPIIDANNDEVGYYVLSWTENKDR